MDSFWHRNKLRVLEIQYKFILEDNSDKTLVTEETMKNGEIKVSYMNHKQN